MALGRLSVLKWKLGEHSDTYNEQLLDALETATAQFESFCKRSLRLQNYVEYYNLNGGTKLYTENYPIVHNTVYSRVVPNKTEILDCFSYPDWITTNTTVQDFTVTNKIYLTDHTKRGKRLIETNWLTLQSLKWYNTAKESNQICTIKLQWIVDDYQSLAPKVIANPENYKVAIKDETGRNLNAAECYIYYNNNERTAYKLTFDDTDFSFLNGSLLTKQIISFKFTATDIIGSDGKPLLYDDKDKMNLNVYLPIGYFVFTETDKGYVEPRDDLYKFELYIDDVLIDPADYMLIKDTAVVIYLSKFPTEEYKVKLVYSAGFDDRNYDVLGIRDTPPFPQVIENAIIEHATQIILETKGNSIGEGIYRISKTPSFTFDIEGFSKAYRDAVALYTRR